MKKIFLVMAALILISATAVTTTQIVQPKVPTDVKVLKGHKDFEYEKALESILNTYKRIGYVVKSLSMSEYSYLIILEKY